MGEEEKKPEVDGEKKTEPPPPPDIVLRVGMHCQGCARKVKKSLRRLNGVEDVTTDFKNHRVVVKGTKADPLKVQERVQAKSRRNVELLSPLPKPPVEEKPPKPAEPEPEPPKEHKKNEPNVVTVVLKVNMHCEACAAEIKRRIERMTEVEEATPDLSSSRVTVKGTFEPSKLVEYVFKKTGKHSEIVKLQSEKPKEEGGKPKEEKKEEKEKEGEGEDEKAAEKKKEEEEEEGEAEATDEGVKEVVEMKRNEVNYYPPKHEMEMHHGYPPNHEMEMHHGYPPKYEMEVYHAYPPQIFSDENPNACSIM